MNVRSIINLGGLGHAGWGGGHEGLKKSESQKNVRKSENRGKKVAISPEMMFGKGAERIPEIRQLSPWSCKAKVSGTGRPDT